MGTSLTLRRSDWLEPRQWTDSTKPLSFMDRLYNRLDGAYPNRWRAAFAGEGAIQNWREAWAEAFVEEGLAPEEIKTGLANCRRLYDWPPSLPEFIKACRPPLDYEAAFYEAVVQIRARENGGDKWSNPAIYYAAIRIGHFDLTGQTYQSLKGRWVSAVDNAAHEIRTGRLANEIPAALPPPENNPLPMEEQRRRISALADVLGMKLSRDMQKSISDGPLS